MSETKYIVKTTSQFKKDYKLAKKQGHNMELLKQVIAMLADGVPLPEQYKDHSLSGNWVRHRECHILPDWLLIYKYDQNTLILTLVRTGSHNNLFGK